MATTTASSAARRLQSTRPPSPPADVFVVGELRRRRTALGMTQAELAAVLRVTATTVARWERGDKPIGHPERIRSALNDLAAADEDDADLAPAREPATAFKLPSELSSFVGRERERAEVVRLLTAHRLVTLTGAGGVGKTRLAVHVAGHLAEQFADGVRFAPLATITQPALVLSRIAHALGVARTEATPVLDQLQQVLADKQLLLVLDNFEQVLPAASPVAELLRGCPRLSVLVTSRAVLHVSGEHIFVVPPLGQPEVGAAASIEQLCQYEAIQLFVERARAAQPTFTITSESAPTVAEICSRVDGLPLAIELAAARVRVLPPATILARLTRRLEVLVDGPRDQPQRHQTLRAAIAWSYELLNDEEQAQFQRLGVFAGGCTLRAAEAVGDVRCASAAVTTPSTIDMLSVLSSLVNQGLVEVDQSATDEPRFRLLQTIREYAIERLGSSGQEAQVRMRQAAYLRGLLDQLGALEALWAAEGTAGADHLEREQDNLREVLRWALDAGESDIAFGLIEAARSMWFSRGHFGETRRWTAELLARPESQARTSRRALLLNMAGSAALRTGAFATARSSYVEGLSIARELGDRVRTADLLLGLSSVAIAEQRDGDSTAQEMLAEALALSRELGDSGRTASMLNNLGWLACSQGEYDVARGWAHAALALARTLRSAQAATVAFRALGYAAHAGGNAALARSLFQTGLTEARPLGRWWATADLLNGLGWVATDAGNYDEAYALLTSAVQLCRDIGETLRMVRTMESFASLAAAQGKFESALALAASTGVQRADMGARPHLREQQRLESVVSRARAALGRARAEHVWGTGRGLSLERTIAVTQSMADAHARCCSQELRACCLTAREEDVARLVARGLSNAEIALELVIGARTVQTHVSNILSKLGFTSRSQIAAWVAERGASSVAAPSCLPTLSPSSRPTRVPQLRRARDAGEF